MLASVAGVLIAGWWFVSRTRLELADLYLPEGRYWFSSGRNCRAVVAFAAGAVLAVGGAYSSPGAGPFPAGGMIPFLKPLYDYSWAVVWLPDSWSTSGWPGSSRRHGRASPRKSRRLVSVGR